MIGKERSDPHVKLYETFKMVFEEKQGDMKKYIIWWCSGDLLVSCCASSESCTNHVFSQWKEIKKKKNDTPLS